MITTTSALSLREKFLSRLPSGDVYRSIFENAIEGIFQTSPSGHYLNVNPALARMYGYESAEDLIEQLTTIRAQLYVDPLRRDERKCDSGPPPGLDEFRRRIGSGLSGH